MSKQVIFAPNGADEFLVEMWDNGTVILKIKEGGRWTAPIRPIREEQL
jgi:hypothetical protein